MSWLCDAVIYGAGTICIGMVVRDVVRAWRAPPPAVRIEGQS